MKYDENNQKIKPRILIGATGSVDIVLLPRYLSAIKAAIDCTLTVLMTNSAIPFLPAETVALYADRVISGEKPQDWPTDKPSRIVADHDLMAVLPATANTMASAAHGATPNRLTTVILASTFPVLFFPVMGSVMWEKNATRRNIRQLNDDGYHVIEPVWHENFDASLQKMVGHPSLPDIETVISLLKQYLPK
ncbi:flavoprotein [Xenorhabdus bovienii]|uniref:Phosphopantothenoylcysteine decarboxylase (Flavoprotein) n=1 Tax=Xenorhabdus bovienii str. feltiae Moldova TaxID=1398200 RepID=A0A077NJQ6_XENBV|nr:flavoprotein [Xenorhabdus bovienii]CDG87000.1 Phosphopantothenoylcysteine decarboxylase (flavoprotein) [Xenorhabdus bovienii str. feltiae France]CDG92884.1 Phosphopantothenoylcysteine decarboxylase (flavoprotein) [Xenorhabdus bovienii str. feltiae Florida]CDH02332.1 Phosphopantothenoylcysteine decarboxylase (flavoprotein) [Xenorhabdus bovienii str. feltiae Moldova]